MKRCFRNIIITAITTFFVTVLLVFLVLYLSKTSSGGGSGNSSNVISGIWYHDLDSVSDKKRVVVSIGQCTNEDGVYQPIEVDNNLYPMCGSIFLQGITSKIVQGSDVYCADCYFRFTEGNNLEMYSKCIQNYANDLQGPLFSGWKYDTVKNIIYTQSGELIPVSDTIIGIFSNINDDDDDDENTQICQRKRLGDICENICPTCKEISCNNYSMCGSDTNCKCPI